MTKAIGTRLRKELHAKILPEAEQKNSSVSQIIREKIEQGYAGKEVKELEQKLAVMEAKILEMAPQCRRAEILSWWSLIMFAEYIKCDLGAEKFRSIEKIVDEKYKDYLKTRELKF
jgi:hypothetical protein